MSCNLSCSGSLKGHFLANTCTVYANFIQILVLYVACLSVGAGDWVCSGVVERGGLAVEGGKE
jgi:hypothetical protein